VTDVGSDRVGSVDGLEVVVDADAHVREGIDDLVPYIDERYGAVREIVAATKRPLADIYSVTHAMPSFPFAENVHGDTDGDPLAGGYDPEDKLAEMREFDASTVRGMMDETAVDVFDLPVP
jgi:hypothetical protein